MYPHVRIRTGAAVALFMASLLCMQESALANIYAYTAGDGSVSLSNVPGDDRYAILVNEPEADKPVADADHPPSSTMTGKADYDKVVAEVARTYGLDGALLHAVISVESRYQPNALSKKGAAGLMQLMPTTARRYGVTNRFDPVQNLHGGAKHIRYLLKAYHNDVRLALAAYNAGEAAVAKYGNRIPPYRETADYVPRVLGYYRKYRTESL